MSVVIYMLCVGDLNIFKICDNSTKTNDHMQNYIELSSFSRNSVHSCLYINQLFFILTNVFGICFKLNGKKIH